MRTTARPRVNTAGRAAISATRIKAGKNVAQKVKEVKKIKKNTTQK
jgi:hypothetical protein